MDEPTLRVVSTVLYTACAFVVFGQLSRWKDTTLVAPIIWSVIALALLAVTPWLLVVARFNGTAISSGAKFMVAICTFCPEMAILGAKRPQDRGWQFIVGSLVVVLSLPVMQTLVFSKDAMIELHWAWNLFFWILIVTGILNHIFSPLFLPSLLLASAQITLLSDHLWIEADPWDYRGFIASLMIAAAVGWTYCFVFKKSRPPEYKMDRIWIDFRNAFGTLWSLRIMDRVNHLATQEDWSFQLTWNGIQPKVGMDKTTPNREDSEFGQLEQCLRTLLRRFVSKSWIDQRMAIETNPTRDVS